MEQGRRYFGLAGDQASKIAGDSEALAHYKKAISAHEEIFGDQLNDFDKAVYTRKLGEIYFRRGEHDKALESFKKAFMLNSFVIQIPENISLDPINQTG